MKCFKYYFLILLCYFSINIHTAPRIETDQSILPDENFSTIAVEDELITRKLEVTESATICKEAYLCNATVGASLSVQGDATLENLTVTSDTNLGDLTVSGNAELTVLIVSGSTILNDLNVSGNSQLTDLTVTGDTLLNNGSVIGNFTIDGTLSVGNQLNLNSLTVINDTDIGCNLTVGCNIYTQNSNFSIGNYYKGGVLWLHNFGTNNTFLGKNAGNLTITGSQNVGIGDNSLTVLAAGNSNTALGYFSGRSVTTGSSNTAVGHAALGNQTLGALTGSNNTAVGNSALNTLSTTGNGNTAVGQGSMIGATTATNNTALGQGTLPNLSSGSSNIAIGSGAGTTLITGSGNIYINANATIAAEANTTRIGTSQTRNFQVGIRGVTPANTDTALVSIDSANQLGTGIIYNDINLANTTATQGAILKNGTIFLHNFNSDIFLGINAGNRTGTGGSNIGIGNSATNSLTSGRGNIGIGDNALTTITDGINNIAIGREVLAKLSPSAQRNVAIGSFALRDLDNGNSNIAIGDFAGYLMTTGSNNIYIGNTGLDESNTIRLGNNSHTGTILNGNLIFEGLTATTATIINNEPLYRNTSSGQIFRYISSRKFKKNIQPISDEAAQKFIQLQPVSYNALEDNSKNPHTIYGFIAEDVNEIMPELVTYDSDGNPITIGYVLMHSLLLKLIQDHDKKIKALEAGENLEKSGKTDTKTIKLIKTEVADHSERLNTQESIISQLKTKIENQDHVIESLISDIALLKAIIESVSKTTKIAK